MWTTPSKKPLSHHNDSLHHNQIEPKATVVMVLHQNRVARGFIQKVRPEASYPWFRTCLIQTGAKPRETRPGGWESASEKNRKACGAESRGKERKAQQSGCNRTCVPQVASKCSCKKQECICGTSIQPVWQRGPDTMTGRKEADRL